MKSTMWLSSLAGLALLGVGMVVHSGGQAPAAPPTEALTGYDDESNGFADSSRRIADQNNFEEVEEIAPQGLGPLYNAQSCRECHQNPVTGAASQITELRVGHLDRHGQFQNPEVPINEGQEVIKNRNLINDRAICPQIQERVPDTETVRTTRIATSTLGDGYVEAIADRTLTKIRNDQCKATHGKICGQAVMVPVPETEGQERIGRFGWKDQHASLLAFAADAYLNEMGITNRLQKVEVTTTCNPPVTTTVPNADTTKITEPNSLPDATGLEDIDHFASFMRSLKAPARDEIAAATPEAKRGADLFRKIGCAICHVETIVTGNSPAVGGGTGLHPEAVENRTIHPYSDFLLHNVGTGDGIPIALFEHFGRERIERYLSQRATTSPTTTGKTGGTPEDECSESYQTAVLEGEKHPDLLRDTRCARKKVRTAPLWGLRVRSRLMHDGTSVELADAIERHKGEAAEVTEHYKKLKPAEQKALLAFLKSL